MERALPGRALASAGATGYFLSVGFRPRHPTPTSGRTGATLAPVVDTGIVASPPVTRSEGCLDITPFDATARNARELTPAPADDHFALLYEELHRLAERVLRRDGGAITLGATTLVHEAYLNVAGRETLRSSDRARFLGYAARAMRGLVVDHARRRRAVKRGRLLEITLGGEEPTDESLRVSEELVQLGEALDALAALSLGLAELVDLHFFAGFAFTEIAELRGVSERTVQRDWRKARLLLRHAMLDGVPHA